MGRVTSEELLERVADERAALKALQSEVAYLLHAQESSDWKIGAVRRLTKQLADVLHWNDIGSTVPGYANSTGKGGEVNLIVDLSGRDKYLANISKEALSVTLEDALREENTERAVQHRVTETRLETPLHLLGTLLNTIDQVYGDVNLVDRNYHTLMVRGSIAGVRESLARKAELYATASNHLVNRWRFYVEGARASGDEAKIGSVEADAKLFLFSHTLELFGNALTQVASTETYLFQYFTQTQYQLDIPLVRIARNGVNGLVGVLGYDVHSDEVTQFRNGAIKTVAELDKSCLRYTNEGLSVDLRFPSGHAVDRVDHYLYNTSITIE